MFFLSRRSAGVKVSRKVHRIIKRGDGARAVQDWNVASEAYREAVRLAPHLSHIFVQLGHAEKELGHYKAAMAAYAAAFKARQQDTAPLILLAKLQIRLGELAAARDSVLRALRIKPIHPQLGEALADYLSADAVSPSELGSWLDREPGGEIPSSVLLTALRAAATPDGDDGQERPSTPTTLFDVTDLVRYCFWSRTLTGIQRVQVELVRVAFAQSEYPIRLLSYNPGRGFWVEIRRVEYEALVDMLGMSEGDEHAIQAARDGLRFRLLLRENWRFIDGDRLIDLGGSWEFGNYFIAQRQARRHAAIHYSVFFHDLIPIVFPGRHSSGLAERFAAWIFSAVRHAECFFAASQSTKRDLLAIAARLGLTLDESRIEVVALGASFSAAPGRREALSALPPAPFVLLVSTIEPRKGHLTAFEAWQKLIARHGAAVPQLVCVGKMGWLYEPIMAKLKEDPALRGKVTILSGLSDEALNALYDACLFTIYPSFYEGWGLPVTESLVHGKAAIVSHVSSLPEAGGDFAVYVQPGDSQELSEAVHRLVFEPSVREDLERRIVEDYRPRTWAEIADQVCTAAWAANREGDADPGVGLGCWHALGLPALEGDRGGALSGEWLRMGRGWLDPDELGCRFSGQSDTQLVIENPAQERRFLYLQLRGADGAASRWRIRQSETILAAGEVAAQALQWTQFEPLPQTSIELTLETDPLVADIAPRDEFSLQLRVVGLAICRIDAESRLPFTEAALTDLPQLVLSNAVDTPPGI